jgi:hypothetical protein
MAPDAIILLGKGILTLLVVVYVLLRLARIYYGVRGAVQFLFAGSPRQLLIVYSHCRTCGAELVRRRAREIGLCAPCAAARPAPRLSNR